MRRNFSEWMVNPTPPMRCGDFVTPCHIYAIRTLKGRGYGGLSHAVTFFGNTKSNTLTYPQQSFRNDLIIWMEASTTSAEVLITDNKRFYQTFANELVLELVKICLMQAFNIEPIQPVAATDYLRLTTEEKKE